MSIKILLFCLCLFLCNFEAISSFNVIKAIKDKVAEKWGKHHGANSTTPNNATAVNTTSAQSNTIHAATVVNQKTEPSANQTKVTETVLPQYHSTQWNQHFECIQNCSSGNVPGSCEEAMSSAAHKDGVYLLQPKNTNLKPFFAYCERNSGKVWMLIQRRQDGKVSFNKGWKDYKEGFGDLNGNFWLGLERMHALTTQRHHELKIWLESRPGATAYAQYSKFSIGSEQEKYKLHFEGYSGTAGNSLEGKGTRNHLGMKFSTIDNCNDHSKKGQCCSIDYSSGWWFNKCYQSNLNGVYNAKRDGIAWNDFHRELKTAHMAIRAV